MTIKITKMEDRLPVCPYCEKELNEIYFRAKGLGYIEAQHDVYFCPHCRKILGIGTSRMM
ncbi:MAG: hypothetical protein NTV06_04200 [candidate division Zixibacteria bacterium]|nr:hypothetical protein [candidate division Zixibacteria bacterium]